MKIEDISIFLRDIKRRNPDLKSISIDFSGSGDSFDGYGDLEVYGELFPGETLMENDLQDILEYSVEHSDADFNNDGTRGTVEIDFCEMTINVNTEYYVTETVAGSGWYAKLEEPEIDSEM